MTGDPEAQGGMKEFSFKTRAQALERMKNEEFDLLIVGGGITGAATARDAVARGLKVALVERRDFAYGTSSRSSKLVHGGFRYLQNFEFNLVFEALSERTFLLDSAPDMVRPLPFYFPVYKQNTELNLLFLGMWVYDFLALFRSPGFHRRLSKKQLLKEIPFLNEDQLVRGFQYFDASMWDDVLTVETVRYASAHGAAVANYVEASQPIWDHERIVGFHVKDEESGSKFELRAKQVVLCVGPWLDEMGAKLSSSWTRWLNPSKGVHLVFCLERIPIPGAMVMTHPEDGRISFVIPRSDYGAGVVIVGTTDGPTSNDPDQAKVEKEDIAYLMDLLNRYFPSLKLTHKDIISTYVGVRPLMNPAREAHEHNKPDGTSGSSSDASSVLQKVSREHHIAGGPGGTVVVAGGKYTTHRRIANELVDFALKTWKKEHASDFPAELRTPDLKEPLMEHLSPEKLADLRARASASEQARSDLDDAVLLRYGEASLSWKRDEKHTDFPYLQDQFRFALQHEMIVHLEDFFFRRVPLFMTRKDHGKAFVETLTALMAKERSWDRERCNSERVSLEKALSHKA